MLERLRRWASDLWSYTVILDAEQDRVIEGLVGGPREL